MAGVSTTEKLGKSPLHAEHERLGGQMVPFGGFLMPIQYSSIVKEHLAVRNEAGLFDTSHMGEFLVIGSGAENFLQRALTNDMTRCKPGGSIYSPMCRPDGGTVDDLFVYNITGQAFQDALPIEKSDDPVYLVVVNASNIRKDFDWLEKVRNDAQDATLTNISPSVGMLALQGPLAQEILSPLISADLAAMQRFAVEPARLIAGKGGDQELPVIVSRTGYTGEDGFELYVPADSAVTIWNTLLDAGGDVGLVPAGLGARDSLRLEACYPLYGHELEEDISPVEGGIGWAVKKTDPPCVGSEVLLDQKKHGPPRTLVALEIEKGGIPRQHYPILQPDSEDPFVTIGEVTSGTRSPVLGKSIALGLVETGITEVGETLYVEIRDRRVPAQIIKRPFYKYKSDKI